jgi:hypothetical protein
MKPFESALIIPLPQIEKEELHYGLKPGQSDAPKATGKEVTFLNTLGQPQVRPAPQLRWLASNLRPKTASTDHPAVHCARYCLSTSRRT